MKICDSFLIFAQNIECRYTLEPPKADLASTHNLCFGFSDARLSNAEKKCPSFKNMNLTLQLIQMIQLSSDV